MTGACRAALIAALGCGCNSIFGLHDHYVENDANMIDAPPAWTMHLTWQVFAGPGTELAYPGIKGATVEVVPFGMTKQDARYDDTTGVFYVDRDVTQHAYSLLIEIGPVTTEVLLENTNAGHYVMPLLGSVDRPPPPGNAQLTFQISGTPPSNFIDARMWTFPNWTTQARGNSTNPVTFDYAGSLGLGGSLMKLPLGDLAVIANGNNVAPYEVYGYAAGTLPADLGPGPVTVDGAWHQIGAAASSLTLNRPTQLGPTSPATRLGAALNGLFTTTNAPLYGVGVMPSKTMPSFGATQPGTLDQMLAVVLAHDPPTPGVGALNYNNPFDGSVLPALQFANLAQDSTTRTSSDATPGSMYSVTLTSGLQMVAAYDVGDPPPQLDYPVGLAKNIALEGLSLSQSDKVTIAAGGKTTLALTFSKDAPSGLPTSVDACLVTLYELDGSAMTTVYQWFITALPESAGIPIPTDKVKSGKYYTFGVRCTKGFTYKTVAATMPDKDHDFSYVAPTMAQSIVYSATFKVTP